MAQGLRRAPVALIDASALFALADADDADHDVCVAAYELIASDTIVVSPFTLAEADYLIADRLGIDAELAFLRDVERGAYRLVDLAPDELSACIDVVTKYRNLDIGLADASIVVLAHRLKTRRIVTLEPRHFETMRPLSGGHFDLIPD